MEGDMDATMTTLGPEDDTGAQGLILPSRDRVMYRPPPGKSALGMVVLGFTSASVFDETSGNFDFKWISRVAREFDFRERD
jgi:hypothetical protein